MREVTPGFIWDTPEGMQPSAHVDLREYLFPDAGQLESVWNDKYTQSINVGSTRVNGTMLNPRGEEGDTLFLGGYGVTLKNLSGARSAALMGAINMGHRVLFMESIEGMRTKDMDRVATGDFSPVADCTAGYLHRMRFVPNVIAGHSKGAREAVHIAKHKDINRVAAISLSEPPGASEFKLPVLDFGIARAGVLENILSKSRTLIAAAENEKVLHAAIPEGSEVTDFDKSWLSSRKKAIETIKVIKGLGSYGLEDAYKELVLRQPNAFIAHWHGSMNTAMPVKATQKMVERVQDYSRIFGGAKVVYMESPTRHNSGVAQSAKFARQVRWTTDQVGPRF